MSGQARLPVLHTDTIPRRVQRNDSLIAQLRSELAKTAQFQRLLAEPRLDVTSLAVEARALLSATLQEAGKRRLAIIVPGDAAIDDFESALRLFHRQPHCVSAYPSPSLSPALPRHTSGPGRSRR